MMTTAATGNPHDVFSYTCVVQEQVHTIAATVDVIIMFMILVAISVTARRNKTSKYVRVSTRAYIYLRR